MEIRDLLRRLLHLDISEIPSHFLEQMTPLRLKKKHPETRRKRRKLYVDLLQKQRSRIVPFLKKPYYNNNCHHQGFNYALGSNLVDRYKAVPQQIYVSKYVLDDFLTMGKNNAGNNTRKLNKCLYISDII